MVPQAVPILMYHRLFTDTAELAGWPRGWTRYWVLVEEFERQIRSLADRGYSTVPLAALIPGAPPIDAVKPIVVTFDDGWASDLHHARPILKRAGWRSEHFVTVDWIGTAAFMSWDELRSLTDSEAAVHCHSLTHRNLDYLAPAEVRRELEVSKTSLEDRLGCPVEFMSLPGGNGANPAVAAVARALGYKGICTSKVGLNRPGDDPYGLQRIPVKVDTPLDHLLKWVSGVNLYRLALACQAFRLARKLMGHRLYEYAKNRILRSAGTPTRGQR